MIVLKQYPHYLYAETVGVSFQNENGDWVQTESLWRLIGKCRYEVNSCGNTIKGEDGKTRIFSGIVYMPLNTERIVEGANIIVSTEELNNKVLESKNLALNNRLKGKILISSTNLYFSKGLMNCRMWT